MTVVKKIIHRFVRNHADYEEGGELFNQIIPYNVQAYSYKLKEDGDPENPKDYIIKYVLGTGNSTYLEIASGHGVDDEGNPVPELSKEFLITSYEEICDIIRNVIDSDLKSKVTHLYKIDDDTAKDYYGEVIQYSGETTEQFRKGLFYEAVEGISEYRLDETESILSNISDVTIDQESFEQKVSTSEKGIPLSFDYMTNHLWKIIYVDGTFEHITSERLNFEWGLTWEGEPTDDETKLIVYKYKEPDEWIKIDSTDLDPITEALNQEIEDRISGDENLQNLLDTEITRAQSEEQRIDAKLDQEILDRIADVDAEETRARLAETNLQNAIDVEKSRAENAESALQDNIDAEVTRATTEEGRLDTVKADKLTTGNYTVDHLVTVAVGGNYKDSGKQFTTSVAVTESDDNVLTGLAVKTYVDDKIDAAISEAVVFCGIVDTQNDLPETGNTNGDMYWIREFVTPAPEGIIAGRSGAAIFDGTTQEFVFTQDAIYQPDNSTIILNANGQLAVNISQEANNRITVKNDGLHVDVSQIETDLAQEINDRATADTGLQNQITAEVTRATQAEAAEATTRSQADTNLDNAITAEITRATTVEGEILESLQTTNSNLTNEIQNRIADVDAEESRAKAVEEDLQSQITAEVTRATGVEGNLSTAISTERNRAQEQEGILQQNITTEKNRAEGVEGRLTNLTTDAKTNLVAAINEVDSHADTNAANLAQEITDRQNADSDLQGAIEAEQQRAEAVEGDLSDLVTQDQTSLVAAINEISETSAADVAREQQRAENAEADLQSQITAEVNRAKGVEGTLSSLTTDAKTNLVAAINEVDSHADTNASNLNAEISRAKTTEGTLTNLTTDAKTNLVAAINEVDSHADANTTAIGNEVTRATGVEGSLSNLNTTAKTNLVAAINEVNTALGNEVTRATNAESALADDISDLSSDLSDAVTRLSNDISTEATARSNADQTLQSNIDDVAGNLSNEVIARQNADTNLNNIKVDKVTAAVANNIATFVSGGNIKDSGVTITTSVASTETDTHILTGKGIKKYVDDQIDAVRTEGVVYKGTLANETLLPSSGNTNGDLYWIVEFTDQAGTHFVGQSGSAIFNGTINSWDYSRDKMRDYDDVSIGLNSSGALTVKKSAVANNSLEIKSDGLHVDLSDYALNANLTAHTTNTSNPHSVTKAQVGLGNVDNTSDLNKPISTATQTALDGKVDKTTTAKKVYGTDTSGNQTTLSYSKTADANSVAQRDNAGCLVTATPTANGHATTKKYVDDADALKVDKVSTAKRVYGTDASGNQTTYDYDSFGKVDDVKVGNTSVVTNKIANLGTMAGETASDYSTKAVADTLYAEKALESDVDDLWTALDDEIALARDQEAALNTKIETETARVQGVESSLQTNKADKSNTYTKTEVDNMLSSAIHFRGAVPTYNDLPNSGMQTGDMYTVQNTGANYVWDGNVWVKMSETVDLSDYAKTAYVDQQDQAEATARQNADNTKVDKVSSANRVYGTDAQGGQTTYGTALFGNIDDVTVGGTSVVVNRVAPLGSMAGETAADYSKKIVADTLYATKSLETTVATLDDEKSDIKDWSFIVPDTTNMKVLQTLEFDISTTDYRQFGSFANNKSSIADIKGDALFRMTVTGTNINACVEGIISMRQALETPFIIVRNRRGSTSATTTGIKYMTGVYPLAANNGYNWLFEIAAHNATARHVKLEILKTDTGFTWSAGTATTYSSTYQARSILTLYTTDGVIGMPTLNINTVSASQAGYITSFLPKLIPGTMPITGEALLVRQLVFMNNKMIYPATNNTLAIEPGFGIQLISSAIAASTAVNYSYLCQKCAVTDLTNIPHATLAKGAPCYFRCTINNAGNIISDNYVATEMTAGYTWYYIGVAASATAIMFDTTQSHFLTLDNNGKLVRIDGREIADPNAIDAYSKTETDTLLSGKVSKSGDSMTNNLEMTNGSLYLEGIGSNVVSSTSRLNLGTPSNVYAYLTGNNQGAFGIYSETSGTRKGIACYPNQNFFADATTKTIDLGRSNNVWKIGYIDTLSDGTNSISIANIINKVTANAAITGATKCKITYDSKGLVTAGADLAESDIPALHLSKITDVTATATELNYVDGVTSNIQTQLNAKAADSNVVHKTGNETVSGTKTFNDTLELKNNLSFRSYGTNDSGRLQFRAQPSDNVIRGTMAITDGYSTSGSGYDGFVAQMVARSGSTTSDPFNTIRVSNKGIEYIKEANDGTITGQYVVVDDNGLVPSDRLATSGSTGQLLTKTASGQAWQTFEALPSQTGNSGKYLTTNGTTASWNTLATVATSGSYSDLSNKPTINDLVTTTQLAALNSGANTTNIAQITTNKNNISTINGKIPSAATSSNQLADKAFVNSSINAIAAYYITSDVEGDAFATKAALDTGPYYHDGSARTPTENDYAIVAADETHSNACTRYSYTGSQWSFQYIVNDTPFTQAQINAINSGITDTKVSNYDTHVADTTIHVTTTDKNTWNSKQAAITGAASTITSSDLTASRALVSNSSGKVAVSSVTSTELGYVSGVTSAIQTQLNNKQATLVSGTNIKSVNGTTLLGSGDLSTYPSQTGNSGKYLTTNGTSVSWATVDALPSQTGNSGKFLTTNGTTASWIAIEEYTASEVETLWNSI